MKQQLLCAFIFSIFTLTTFSQSVKISAMVEGDCPTGTVAPRVIELYVDGTVDVTNLKIQFQFAFAENWVINNTIGVGEYTDTFLYIVNDSEAFDANFPNIRTSQNTTIGNIVSSVEGGDKVRLVDVSNSNQVIDVFGVDGQNGENKSWNFVNSYVKRNVGSGPNTSFIETEWAISEKNSLVFEGACWSENPLNNIIGLQGSSLDIDDLEIENNFRYFPNPATDFIHVLGIKNEESFVVYNILGVEIINGFIKNHKRIDIDHLPVGIYLLKTEKGKMLKFIKE